MATKRVMRYKASKSDPIKAELTMMKLWLVISVRSPVANGRATQACNGTRSRAACGALRSCGAV